MCITRACFLSIGQSKLRLCSANHRAGYFSNLACDWLSIVWAYSKQETENGPRSQWFKLFSIERVDSSSADPVYIYIYPVHGANLTLIQPMWSAYPYAPTSLYGIHMPLLPYMVIQPIVLGMALLWAAIDTALSQGPLLWRHNDMTVIVSRNTRGRERDTRQRLDNANARRLQTVNR